ncbi:MAG: iron-containing alcohol dehydrogenase [Cellvibrionaceae bacterium]|nr:iron-containing alcohol dehydrogenase [Cellvibrionaceae bacterium]
MKSFSFSTTKSIVNASGALNTLADICRQAHISKPLIITDQGIVKVGLMEKLEDVLKAGNMDFNCYADVVADPPESVVYAALDLLKTHENDGVIGFGGGSSMDTAKLIALMAKSGEKLHDIYGVGNAKGQRLPLILIPTTAGTGSEVTAVAIVTTGETTKAGVVATQLLPDVALLDAELTVGLPASITAATGVDAMVHAIEAYTSARLKNRYSDMLAREALQLLSSNIMKATYNGSDLEARQAMLLGACLAGQAFANAPVAAVHALAYPLGGHFHIPHGLSNSLVLPHVMRFNAPEAKVLYAELAPIIMGKPLDGDAESVTEALIHHIEVLIAELKLPNTLSAMNIAETDLAMLASDAMLQQRLLVNNPRDVTEEDALAIYRAAY